MPCRGTRLPTAEAGHNCDGAVFSRALLDHLTHDERCAPSTLLVWGRLSDQWDVLARTNSATCCNCISCCNAARMLQYHEQVSVPYTKECTRTRETNIGVLVANSVLSFMLTRCAVVQHRNMSPHSARSTQHQCIVATQLDALRVRAGASVCVPAPLPVLPRPARRCAVEGDQSIAAVRRAP